MLERIISIIDTIAKIFKPKYKKYNDHRLHPIYKQKKIIVKNIWIISGMIMVFLIYINPSLPAFGIVFAIGLLTTFIAFMILDETFDPDDE